MKFTIEKLGKIKKAEIELNDLTIICGPNSASKTWLSYSIYHYLNHFHSRSSFNKLFGLIDLENGFNEPQLHIDSEKFKDFLTEVLDFSADDINNSIHKTFNTFESIFLDSSIKSDALNDFYSAFKDAVFTNDAHLNIGGTNFTISKESKSKVIDFYRSKLTDFENIKDEDEDELSPEYFAGVLLLAAIENTVFSTSNIPHRPFVITSERVGSLVFQKDIDGSALSIRNALDNILEQNNENPHLRTILAELNDLTLGNRASVAVPVRRNLLAVRNASEELKKTSFLAKEHPYVSEALNEIVKGKFTFESGSLVFSANDGSHQLPITVASSSIKSTFMIDLYVNSLAKKGDVLLIDEPELNLHPDNQRLMAKVIARIANSGIKVLITTHSDYLVREINNFIMLSREFEEKEELMIKYNLTNMDILNEQQVKAYSVDNLGEVTLMDMLDTGIDSKVFDNIILDANELQEELFDALGV